MPNPRSGFSKNELRRYSRQLNLPGFGLEGQKKLKSAKICVAGLGGLGSPASLYLAAAGVGTLGIIDDDTVQVENLQRQILYSTPEIGKSKTGRAAARLSALNPGIKIIKHPVKITPDNAKKILRSYDLVLDCSDNFVCRRILNDACIALKKPLISGSVYRFEGQVAVLHPGTGPCYRCLYPEMPPDEAALSCEQAGILGVIPGIIGAMEALEALKWLFSKKDSSGKLFIFDGLSMELSAVQIRKSRTCPACK